MKILVIFTGGTIGSTNDNGFIAPASDKIYKLIDMYNKRVFNTAMQDKVVFEVISPYNMLSENMTCSDLRKLAGCVKEIDSSAYDGIILTHGTDTLQFTAAFISYIIGNYTIPVVFVSSNYVLEDLRSNGLDNFYYAVKFICESRTRGVFVSYRNSGDLPKIHMAARLIEYKSYDDSLYSVCDEYYAYFKEDKLVYKDTQKDHMIADDENYEFNLPDGDWYSGVLRIEPYVGMKYPELSEEIRAVLHSTYHSGTICAKSPDLKEFAHIAAKKNIPVFITGAGIGIPYESEKCYKELGFNILPAASPIAMYVKLWLCVINGFDNDKIVDIMKRKLVYDILN